MKRFSRYFSVDGGGRAQVLQSGGLRGARRWLAALTVAGVLASAASVPLSTAHAADTSPTALGPTLTSHPPSAPQNLSFVSSNESLVLDWDEVTSDPEVTNYVVQYRVEDTMDWTTWTRTSSATDTEETITGLTNYTVYEVQVAARNGDTDEAIGDYATIDRAMPSVNHEAVPGADLWSDGTTYWVLRSSRGEASAYTLATGEDVRAKDADFKDVNSDQSAAEGICSDGTTTWVSHDWLNKIYAYEHALDDGTLAYTSDKDIDTGSGSTPAGLWCDEDTLLAVSNNAHSVRVYDLPSGVRDSARDIDGLTNANGVWSDGVTIWVRQGNTASTAISAYSAIDGARREWLDIKNLDAAAATNLRGLWSDGNHMWVADITPHRVFKFPLPQYGDGPPVPRSAEVSANGTTVEVTFTEALAAGVVPAALFEVTVGSGTVTLDSVADISAGDTSVTLTLPDAAGEGVAVTVAYNDLDDDQTTGVVQDAGGADAPSFTKLSATPRAVTAPGAPTALVASPGNVSLTVSWTAPTTTGTPDTYAVRYRLTSADADMDSSYTTVARGDDAAATSETISGLTNDTGYTVQVNAINTAGTSAWVSVTGTPAAATTEVPKNWTLKPTGLDVGDQFRLLFVTFTTRDASTASLSVYDTHVQNAVNNGHFDLKPYSSQFEVLGSSTEADARDHTETNFTAADTGVPIYYLGGAKVADNYQDFYDGSWASHSPTNEAGDDSDADQVWTGTNSDGTVSGRGFGNNSPDSTTLGDPTSSTTNHVLNHSSSAQSDRYPLYGLSPVFEVSSTAVVAEVASVAVTSTPEAASETYGVGEVIQFTVTFYHPVEVSTDRPHFEFSLGGTDTDADYQGGSGTKALTFAYTVLAADTDTNGIWIGDQDRTIKFDADEYIHTVGGDDLDAILNHPTLGTRSGHKVNGSLTVPPSAPQNLSFVSLNESLVLDWDTVTSDPAVTNYVVQYRVEGTMDWTTWTREVGDALETEETIDGLTNYTVYEVQVAARNGDTDAAIGDYATIDRAMPSVNHEAVLGTGLWSDGTTYWVLRSNGEAKAYTLASGERQMAKDADFEDQNSDQSKAEGICSDGTTTWVSGDSLDKIYAYEHALDDGTLAYTSDKDIDTGSGSTPAGLWCDEDTLLAVANNGHEVRVYDLPSGVRDSARDIDGLTNANGVWSDGVTIWVEEGNAGSTAISAYSALDGARREWLDIKNLDAAAATDLRGLWSDGTHMWGVHFDPHRVFKFPLPQYGDGPPVPRSAEVSADGTTVEVTFTEALAAGVVPAALFEVTVGSASAPPDSVADISAGDTSVTLTLSPAAGEGVAVTVAYNDPDNDQTDNVVQDTGGADAPSFTKLSATPRAVTAPGAPTALTADPGDASLTVSWTAPTTSGAPDTYAVRYRLTSADPDMDSSYTTVARGDAAATSETISGLTNDTGYTVQVNATNTAGTSAWASVTGTPSADNDATLSVLTLMEGSNTVPLTPSFANGTTVYRAWVANGVSSVTVTATATASTSGASVAITSDSDTNTPNTAVLPLAEGANTITVTVTARDNLTTGTYTITAVREAAAPTADPTALLTAKLTAAQDGTVDTYGYQPGSSTEGALTDNDFDYNGTTHTITNLFWNSPDELILICFSSIPSESVYNNWTLRVGDDDYVFDSNRVSVTECASWPRTDPLAYGDVETVKIFGNRAATKRPVRPVPPGRVITDPDPEADPEADPDPDSETDTDTDTDADADADTDTDTDTDGDTESESGDGDESQSGENRIDCDDLDTQTPFVDVPKSLTAYNDIACIYALGVTTGTTPTTYSPTLNVSRAQMASFLARLYKAVTGTDAPVADTPFTDVTSTSSAYDDIGRIYGLGVTTGTTPTTYSPTLNVSRAQMASFLARLYKAVTGTDAPVADTPFTDLANAHSAYDDIGRIYGLGVTTGTSPTTYSPTANVTRAQMASFLARLYKATTATP